MPAMLNVLSRLEKHWLKSGASNSFLIKYFVTHSLPHRVPSLIDVQVYLFLAAVICPALSTTLGGLVQRLAGGSSIFDNLSDVLVDKAGG